MSVTILYVWRYAKKVKNNPEKSILYGHQMELIEVGSKEELMSKEFTLVQASYLCLRLVC